MRLPTLIANSLLGCVLSFHALSGQAAVLFKDSFESRNFLTAINGARWLSQTEVTISSKVAKSGGYSAQFHFAGNPDLNADAWSEMRFDLGVQNKELWIKFDLYIPTNYVHRATGTAQTNNKLLRLWGTTYDDKGKVGFSMWANHGDSLLQGDWNSGGGTGPKGNSLPNFISASDLGKWMTVKIYVKAPASDLIPGTMKLWKNGLLVIDDTNLLKDFYSGETNAFRYGYLLGWSASGFTEDTNLYIDNVIFGTQESDMADQEGRAPEPPVVNAVQ